MNRRARTLAGVLTLSAMTFSSAETVFASMCTPMPEMGVVAANGSSDAPDCLLMSGPEGGHDPSGDRTHCPLNPAVGSSCTAVASHPSAQTADAPWALGTFPDHATEDSRPDLLLSRSLFRPPRA
jgi:hypothetical protein